MGGRRTRIWQYHSPPQRFTSFLNWGSSTDDRHPIAMAATTANPLFAFASSHPGSYQLIQFDKFEFHW
jgi:hypothetical protein